MKRLLILLAVLPLFLTGCVKEKVKQPVADFSVSSNFNPIYYNDDVFFNNNSTNAGSYYWQFGDGGTSTEISPTYYYLKAGTYSVTLTAYNGSLSSTISTTVTVYPANLVVTVKALNNSSTISQMSVRLYLYQSDWAAVNSNYYIEGTTDSYGVVEFDNVNVDYYYVDLYDPLHVYFNNDVSYAITPTLTGGITNYFTAWTSGGKKDASLKRETSGISLKRETSDISLKRETNGISEKRIITTTSRVIRTR